MRPSRPFVRLSPLGKAQSCRRANSLRCVAPPRAHRQCQISQATQISQAVISQWLRYKCVIIQGFSTHTDLTCRPRATDRYKGNNQWVDQNLVRHTLPRQQNALPFLPLRLCSGASCAQGAWLDFMEGGGAGTETSPAPISPPLGTCTRLPIPVQRQLPGIELTECLCVDPRVTAAGAMTLEAEDDDSARSPSPDSPAPFSLHSADPHDRPPAGDSDDGAVSGTPELSPKQGGTPASPRSALANSPPRLVSKVGPGIDRLRVQGMWRETMRWLR